MLIRWFLTAFECQDQDQDQDQARASPRSIQAHVWLKPMAWLRPFWEFRVPQSFTTIYFTISQVFFIIFGFVVLLYL